MYSTRVCVTHTKMNQGSVCSSSVHTGSQTGTVGLPGAQDAAVNTWTWSRHLCNAFLVTSTTPFWQEPMIQPATRTKLTRMQFCQANKNAIFAFRLQKMLNPSLASSPSLLVGRKCLSSAQIHEGMFGER